jgi:hypothetical protein
VLAALGLLTGCVGPEMLSNGRGTYNAVINRTEDEQILSMIVRQRYDETYGLLSVSSVTASIHVGATAGANVGVGPERDYLGNLVPLSASAAYEENPTISYTPLRGEDFVERLLAPLSAEHILLLGRMSTTDTEAWRLLVRRANGLTNPVYAAAPPGPDFDRFVDLNASLRDQGVLDVVQTEGGAYEMLFHDCSTQQATQATELIRLLGIQRTVQARADRAIPLRFVVGPKRGDGIDLEGPSALQVVEAAGLGVEIPADDAAEGVVRTLGANDGARVIVIDSSSSRPENASVAVTHRGSWFFIDARDARSKQTFMILRTLIGLRLDEGGEGQQAPMLTVPVAR